MPNKPIVFLHDTISEEKQKAFAVKRWQRDGVEALPPGVSLLPHGRAASIYRKLGELSVRKEQGRGEGDARSARRRGKVPQIARYG